MINADAWIKTPNSPLASTFHWQGETVRLILRFETQPHTPVSFAWLHGSHTLSRCRSTVCFALPVRGVIDIQFTFKKSLSVTNLDQRRLPLMISLRPRSIQREPLPFVKPPGANVVSEYPQDRVHCPALAHPIFRGQIELCAVPVTPVFGAKINRVHLLRS